MRYLQNKPTVQKYSPDLKDRKILGLLASNARLPRTQLSKKVGLSRDAVSYRINNYEKAGVIQGYRTLVDISRLGYSNYHLFIKLNNPPMENEAKIVSRLSKIPNIRAILKFSGNFDIELALVAKDLNELDNLITQITNSGSGLIKDYEILALTKVYLAESFPKSFIANSEGINERKLKEYKIDKIDLSLLKIIGEDANLNLSEIATKIKLSADAVAYRIKNLIEAGIIVKFIPVINYASLDYNLYAALININPLDRENENKLKGFLETNKNILWAVKTIGRYNVLIYFLIKNTEDLQDTINELRSLFPKQINNYETLLGFQEYKYVYFPKELF